MTCRKTEKGTIRVDALRDLFQENLNQLWATLSNLIGNTATGAIFHSTLLKDARRRPFLGEIRIEERGVILPAVDLDDFSVDPLEYAKGHLDFADSLCALVLDLTGGVLAEKLDPLLLRFRETLEATATPGKERKP